MNYQLQHRYQDSGWEPLDCERFHIFNEANDRAYELSKNSIAYGMVRVVNLVTEVVEVEYPAGGGGYTRVKVEPNPEPNPELWTEYTVYIDGLTGQVTTPICGLCGSTGYVSTFNIRTPNGKQVPTIHQPCICPNGRAIKGEE